MLLLHLIVPLPRALFGPPQVIGLFHRDCFTGIIFFENLGWCCRRCSSQCRCRNNESFDTRRRITTSRFEVVLAVRCRKGNKCIRLRSRRRRRRSGCDFVLRVLCLTAINLTVVSDAILMLLLRCSLVISPFRFACLTFPMSCLLRSVIIVRMRSLALETSLKLLKLSAVTLESRRNAG